MSEVLVRGLPAMAGAFLYAVATVANFGIAGHHQAPDARCQAGGSMVYQCVSQSRYAAVIDGGYGHA